MSLPPAHPLNPAARARMAMVTTMGLGWLKPFPGTWGSMPPVVLAAALCLSGASDLVYAAIMAAGAIGFTLICVVFGDEAEARFRAKDPSAVVADETAGQCVALLAVSPADPRWPGLVLFAFVMFRLLDIVKPPPARQVQAIRGGLGIVLDDLIAGAMAAVAVLAAAALWA